MDAKISMLINQYDPTAYEHWYNVTAHVSQDLIIL